MLSGSTFQVAGATAPRTARPTDVAATPTLADLWSHSVESRCDAPFLTFEGPSGAVADWTYGEFDAISNRVLADMTERGVERGNSVHLALTNSATFVAVWIAAAKMGVWIVPSDPTGTTAELAGQIARTKPALGFCSRSREHTYRDAAGSMSYIAVDEADTTFGFIPEAARTVSYRAEPLDRLAVMFTSGTTGRPKGVEITQANFAFAGEVMAHESGLTPDDRQLVVLPLFHANAQYYSFASAIAVGASVALMHTFSASRFLQQAVRHKATCASLFAAPLRMILARGGPVDELRLRHCWFAQNISSSDYDTITELFGCAPRQLYGMTETIPAVLTSRVEHAGPTTMGSVSDRCEVEIHDADGNAVGPGVEGELVVGGRRGTTLFAGYLDDGAVTAASFRDSWFLTGDRATVDAEGRFFFAGRRSDVLKVAGENVSTVEVEAVLSEHPSVLEAAVVGAPDEIRDEVPVAFVVASDPTSGIDLDDLASWCQDRLAKVKQPRTITVLDSLPRTSVGKIRKFLLRGEAESLEMEAAK
jgi:crotonobetaine/carnitine-CoA ligase